MLLAIMAAMTGVGLPPLQQALMDAFHPIPAYEARIGFRASEPAAQASVYGIVRIAERLNFSASATYTTTEHGWETSVGSGSISVIRPQVTLYVVFGGETTRWVLVPHGEGVRVR